MSKATKISLCFLLFLITGAAFAGIPYASEAFTFLLLLAMGVFAYFLARYPRIGQGKTAGYEVDACRPVKIRKSRK